ncbi:ankyrin repeat domain-containing protein 60-like [Clytia hemisphaerica]|uniref:ankyrin repeat domain-containing protein 60-like n=1 Tax=Clytia hemisphaerica TaxID=252671 RepID=UPI0034D691DE
MFSLDKKEELFKVRIHVEATGDHITLKKIKNDLKISQLKEKIEGFVGIPSYLLQLFYLDECALVDEKSLSYFHILPDARIKARVWKTNRKLVAAARYGSWEDVLAELYLPATKEEISKASLHTSHDLDRPLTALFISCFHGNDAVVEKLLQQGVVNERKPLLSGRHAVQVAATRHHARCVELLLRRKFRPYEWNHERNSLMNWELQDRIKATLERIETKRKISKTQHYTRLTESQKYDSFLSTWYCGEYGKIYLCVILTGETNTKTNPNPIKYNKPVFRP